MTNTTGCLIAMQKNIEIHLSSDAIFHYRGVFVMWVIQTTTDRGPTGQKSHIFPKKTNNDQQNITHKTEY